MGVRAVKNSTATWRFHRPIDFKVFGETELRSVTVSSTKFLIINFNAPPFTERKKKEHLVSGKLPKNRPWASFL